MEQKMPVVFKPDSWWYGLVVPLSVSSFLFLPIFLVHTPTCTHLCFLPVFFPVHAALWLSSQVWIIALSRLSWSYTNNICQLIYHCSPPGCSLLSIPLRSISASLLLGWKYMLPLQLKITPKSPLWYLCKYANVNSSNWCLTDLLTPIVFLVTRQDKSTL